MTDGKGSGRTPSLFGRRRLALALIACAVVLLHAWITRGVMVHLQDLTQDDAPTIERMQATLVADMQLSAPPVVAPPPPAVETPAVFAEPAEPAEPAASEASAPEPPASAAEDSPAEEAASTADTQASAPLAATAPASEASQALASAAPAEPASSATSAVNSAANSLAASSPTEASVAEASDPSTPPPFEWPLATRVTFRLEGYVRGPVYGDAMVEWVRLGQRYQVHVDASIGPRFAPLGSQRWTSEGVITPQGLRPSRFESVNKLLIKSSKPKIVTFGEEELVLANGKRLPLMAGVQDGASHYIQMAYELMLKPAMLHVGGVISLPLARNQHQEMVIYDIVGQEELATPLGKVATFRLRPRPLVDQKDDLLGELWIAPSLQYLPIRMLVRKGEKDFLDMKMDRAPQQATAASAPREAGKTRPTRQPLLQSVPVPP